MKRDNFVVHIVDSDQAIADGLATLLSTYGIDVVSYPDAESFLKFWLPRRVCNCCLIVAADLPDLSGPALLRELRELRVDIPVLLLVSTSSPELIEVARNSSHIGVVEKPCIDESLISRVLTLRAESLTGRHDAARH